MLDSIMDLLREAYDAGLVDGTNKWGSDFDWIHFQDKTREIVGW